MLRSLTLSRLASVAWTAVVMLKPLMSKVARASSVGYPSVEIS
jgi:hypothetical protein